MNLLLKWLGLESGADVHRTLEGAWYWSHPTLSAVWYGVIAVGVLLALVNFLPQIAMRRSVRFATCALRLAILGLLLVVLGGLEWHVGLDLNEKPSWTILVDDSASMATRDADEQSRYAAALADLEKIREQTAGEVQLTVASLSGQPLAADTPGLGPTLLERGLRGAALARLHPDRLILLTDGRDSEGRRLAAVGADLQAHDVDLDIRLYGSADAPVDTGLSAEPRRNLIRLGEDLEVRGALTGKLDQAEATLTLKEDGKAVKTLTLAAADQRRFEIVHRPKKAGKHTYSVELAARDSVAENNAVHFTANVVEEKINVLLIEGFPRYEFKFIKGILEVDPLVNLVSIAHIPGGGVYVQGSPLHAKPELGLISSQAELFKYDVVILRDVSRNYFREGGDVGESTLRNLVEFVTKRGGGLMVLGGQEVFRAGGYETSSLAEVLPFDLSDEISGQPQFDGMFFVSVPTAAASHPLLQLLPDAAENRERLNSLRELDGSNNVGRFKPLATPLLTRSVDLPLADGKTETKEAPIMAYQAVGEGKVVGAAVDTLWRWQLQPDFDDPPLTMLLGNCVRYLAPPPGQKAGAPTVSAADGTPQVGQELLLTTELKDNQFEPIQGADLLVTVTRPDGGQLKLYPRDLPEEPGCYSYRVPLEQVGSYKIVAKYGKQESTRELLVGAAAGEFSDLTTDHAGMQVLADAAGGRVAAGDQAAWLASLTPEPKQIRVERELEVWNSPLVLVLFFLLVSADCYLRKRQGLV